MTGEQKVLLSLEMSEFDREIRKQRIRNEHPNWSELEVMHEIFRHAFLPKPVPEWLEKLMKQRLDEQRARHSTGLE
jgi:transcriptional regulator of met regulon